MSHLSRRLLMCATPPFVGVLDQLTASAAGAWSLRRLRGGYAGPCINVRRSSDNATTDIGFTPDGNLNVPALLAFVGGGDGFVTQWYDQTGSGSHMYQKSPISYVPKIVGAGSLITLSTSVGRACILTDGGTGAGGGSALATDNTTALNLPQPFTRSSVVGFPASPTTASSPILLYSGGGPNNQWVELAVSNPPTTYSMYVNGGFTAISGASAGTSGSILETFNFANSSCTFNGTTTRGSVGATGVGCQLMTIGGYFNSRNIQASYGEIILFPQTVSLTDQAQLGKDQKLYWGTP